MDNQIIPLMPNSNSNMSVEGNMIQEETNNGCYQSSIETCGNCIGFFRTWFPCICCCFDYPYKEITQSYEGLLERFGKYVKSLPSGLQYVNPCSETLQYVNMKMQIIHLMNQQALTKDNLVLSLDTSVYYKVIDSRKMTYSVKDVRSAVSNLTFSTLRNTCGQHILQELLEKREEVAKHIQDYVDDHAHKWGVKVEHVFIKDILLSPDLQFTLSSAAKERKLAESKIISAKADVESAKLMKVSAEILDSKPAMQIRFLETINQITKSPNVRVIFTPDGGDLL